jgi:hypothetical protein
MLTLSQSFTVEANSITVGNKEEFVESTCNALEKSRLQVCIFWHLLDNQYFKHAPLIQNFKEFCLSNHRVKLKILISDPLRVAQSQSAMIALAQKLTSRIELRVLDHSFLEERANFICFDKHTAFYKADMESPKGSLITGSPSKINHLCNYFDNAWALSRPATELRALSI